MNSHTNNTILYQSLQSIAECHIEVHVEQLLKNYNSKLETHLNLENQKMVSNTPINLQSGHTSYFIFWASILQKKITESLAKKVPLIMVTPNDEHARQMRHFLRVFENLMYNNQPKSHKKLSHAIDKNYHPIQKSVLLPSWGNALGTGVSQYAPIRAERAAALYNISYELPDILICSIEQWNQLLPPREVFRRNSTRFAVGEMIDPTLIAQNLIDWNYTRVPRVTNEGEFALRGEVLDVFSSKNVNATGIAMPIRITFDYEHIESIKIFDINSQRTTQEIDDIYLHPRSEYIWDEFHISTLSKNITKQFPEIGTTTLNNTIAQLQTFRYDEWEYLYGMFAYDNPTHLVQYFNNSSSHFSPLVFFTHYEMLTKQEDFYWNKQRELFLSIGNIQCVPRYSRLKELLSNHTSTLNSIPVYRNTTTKHCVSLGDSDNQKFAGNISYFSKYLKMNQEEGGQMYLCVDQQSHIDRISLLINGASAESLANTASESLSDFDKELITNLPIHFVISDLSSGFTLSEYRFACYIETDLLGKKLYHFDTEHSSPLTSIQQIEPGDLIVHIQYGIGKFVQLARLNVAGVEKDFIQIMYAHDEKLYVPIEQMNMVQRYLGQSQEQVVLDAIGGKAWEKRKSKVLQKVEDMSEELLEVHAKRNSITGFTYPSGEEWEEEFIANFPFEETADQLTAWSEISVDMSNTKPMDRLLVGDVGFGKTELAFRAAFRATSSGRQVAFLVPTTILAEQHYYSALERFNSFPINIAMISRFLNTKEQNKVITQLKKGKIDFIIGTHRIIQKDIVYKNLGLCIIDEEHRFGVKDKEYIKKMHPHIDCLALSATPIPRTLYQSMVQLRDMSLLTTAPKKRKPIRTFIEKFDESLVSKAIKLEIARGGQVFYLHNRISSLEEVSRFIEKLVPEATVLTASGKMPPKNLEDTMYRFIHKGANVLVSTTIIENGIDIPNVNTIIIDRADNYGIAQLYQLRGRVGRSDQVSYAYLLYPDAYSISEIALKRLSTISDNSELGAGFQIAMRDLEVRGTGNLLGKEQSGSIFAVGYEYYLQLLDEAMRKVKGLPVLPPEPMLELSYTGFIPDTYINDTSTKMEVYKQIVSVTSLKEYELLMHDLEDKYGPLPQEVLNLFWISKVRILCTSLYVSLLKDTPYAMELHFSNMSKIPLGSMTKLLKEGNIRISKKASNVILIPTTRVQYNTLEKKYKLLEECLMRIIGTEKERELS